MDLERKTLESRIALLDQRLADIQKARREADQALRRLDMEREAERKQLFGEGI